MTRLSNAGVMPNYARAMRLAVLQENALVHHIDANLRAIDAAAARAAREAADVLVTPELFVTGYAPLRLRDVDAGDQIRITAELARIASEHDIALVASYPEVEFPDATDARRQYICATLFGPDGATLLHYRKVHLFGDDEPQAFVGGDDAPTVVDLAGLKVALLVCFDVEFPEAVRAAALVGADVVLAPTALTPGFETVPQVLLRARALENGVALAYANHVGVEDGLELGGGSVVVGPDGALLASGDDEPALLVADVDADAVEAARARVPYLAKRRPDVYAQWAEQAGR